jgi:type IV pilus assembly protein PilV
MKHADFPFVFQTFRTPHLAGFHWRPPTRQRDDEDVKTTAPTEGNMSGNRRQGQRGFSLIEVAVAAAVFSLGLGSMSLLLVLAVHGTYAPRLETLAALHAHSLTEALRLVPGAGAADAGEAAACGPGEVCPPTSMAEAIMESWQGQIERDLPTGRGLVCRDSAPDNAGCASANAHTVTVLWREVDPESGNEALRKFLLTLPSS